MKKLENAILCQFWDCVLQMVDKVSVHFQAVNLDLMNAVTLISSLSDFIGTLRDDFARFETAAHNAFPHVSETYKQEGNACVKNMLMKHTNQMYL